MFRKLSILVLCLLLLSGLGGIATSSIQASTSTNKYISQYNNNYKNYLKQEVPIINAFREQFNGSQAHQIVARAIWYMEYGYMVYGHSNYVKDGRVDCSNFVSLVFKDYGIKIPTASRKYDSIGKPVKGVHSKLQPGSTKKYMLVGEENLKPGDIFTFWKENADGSDRHIAHVAIYMGKINGKPCIIHTISGRPTAIGITNSFRYWYGEHFLEARRVLLESDYAPRLPVIPRAYKLAPQGKITMPQYLPAGF